MTGKLVAIVRITKVVTIQPLSTDLGEVAY